MTPLLLMMCLTLSAGGDLELVRSLTAVTNTTLSCQSVGGIPIPTFTGFNYRTVETFKVTAGGSNVFNVVATPGDTTLTGGALDDVFVVGSAARGIDPVWGRLTIEAGTGTNQLVVEDTGGVSEFGRRYALDSLAAGFTLDVDFTPRIRANGLTAVTLLATARDDTIRVGGVAVPTTINAQVTLETVPVPNQIFLGTHPTPDPLAYLPVPDLPPNGTMTVTSIGSGNKMYVLTPGRFTNLPTFNTGDIVVLKQASAGNNGIYYIDGGGFKSTGATIRMDPLTSGGVMIYNKPNGTASLQKIQITGNAAGSVDLSPLTDGPYQGMMLWQDRTSPVDVLIEGNGTFSVKGTFYASEAKLNINGNGKTETGDPTGGFADDNCNLVTGGSQIGSQYISKNLSLGGNGNITIHYRGPEVARTRIITLVE